MDMKEAKTIARGAKVDIEAILDKLYRDTGISVGSVRVNLVDVTNLGSVSREFRHCVTITMFLEV